MISNAIPGIANVNAYANTTTAKGIAASKQTSKDFQKALASANTDRQAVSVTASVNQTLVNTASRPTEVKQVDKAVKTEKTDDRNMDTSKVDTGKEVTKTDVKDNAQETNTVNQTSEVRDTTQNVAEETAEVTAEVTAEEVVAEVEGTEITDMVATLGIDTEEFDSALLEEVRSLMEQLADELSVDIEDIENAMATLGLTNVAILDPVNMTEIIGQVTGSEDMMAIVTNADLYMSVQDMQDAVDTTRSNLMEEFNLSEEDFEGALEQFSENLAKDFANSETENDTTVVQQFTEEAAVVEIQGANEGIVTEKPRTTTEEVEAKEVSETEVADPETEIIELTVKTAQNKDGSEEGTEDHLQDHEKGSMFNQLMNQISSSLSEVKDTENVQQQAERADTQRIMDQITEFIKVNVKAESTSMELQLHPASLGTVNVMIEQAKDGNMIARFMTQNEDVKTVIESQLQMLQEKFNEQGVKVTAVEVTVNTGGFDQTLNDSQSQKEEDQENQNSIKKPMRRIRLGDLTMDGIEGLNEVDEADQLTAEMMAINGNSVDFSA